MNRKSYCTTASPRSEGRVPRSLGPTKYDVWNSGEPPSFNGYEERRKGYREGLRHAIEAAELVINRYIARMPAPDELEAIRDHVALAIIDLLPIRPYFPGRCPGGVYHDGQE